MEKVFEVICYIEIGILAIFFFVMALLRGLGAFLALVLLFVHSQLPWWILAPAAIALASGFFYLFKRRLARRGLIPRNRKFVN
jgi:membrane protein implicated in regulation of membrane protease activity